MTSKDMKHITINCKDSEEKKSPYSSIIFFFLPSFCREFTDTEILTGLLFMIRGLKITPHT